MTEAVTGLPYIREGILSEEGVNSLLLPLLAATATSPSPLGSHRATDALVTTLLGLSSFVDLVTGELSSQSPLSLYTQPHVSSQPVHPKEDAVHAALPLCLNCMCMKCHLHELFQYSRCGVVWGGISSDSRCVAPSHLFDSNASRLPPGPLTKWNFSATSAGFHTP